MKLKTALFFLIYLFTVCVFGHEVSHSDPSLPVLMPIPAHISFTSRGYGIDNDFCVIIDGPAYSRVRNAAERFVARLGKRSGLFIEKKPDLSFSRGGSGKNGLLIRFKKREILGPDMNEAYSLKITPRGILLEAETDIGVLRGLETLLQLFSVKNGEYVFWGADITDTPRFGWRGLLIDVCRHFMPVHVIRRNIAAMAAVKLNVLHLHLSEDQGFRLECRTFPKLHAMGSDGLYYSREQIAGLIEYADRHGIRIVPEFDIPGHSTAWLVGYPELAARPGPYAIERKWGVFDPVFNPASKKTYRFFAAFFREMAGVFPDPYVHIGGDENNGRHWDQSPEIQKFMGRKKIKNNRELQAYFNVRIHRILKKNKKKMIGWDEILQKKLPKTTVIQSWRGRESLKDAARKGFNAILSKGYYIDLMRSAAHHYLNDPIDKNSDLAPAQMKRIRGGEATMWSELVTSENIDSRIWPRTAAIAERLWSPARIRDVKFMYQRLEIISMQLEELGLTHIRNQDMMLRRLARSERIAPLKLLVSLVEPVEGYRRHQHGITYTRYSPLTRLVDAANADAGEARKFADKADEYSSRPSVELRGELVNMLKKWAGNHQLMKKIIGRSPVLREIEPLSAALEKTARIGLAYMGPYAKQAKDRIRSLEQDLGYLKKLNRSYGELELKVVEPLIRLLESLRVKKNCAERNRS